MTTILDSHKSDQQHQLKPADRRFMTDTSHSVRLTDMMTECSGSLPEITRPSPEITRPSPEITGPSPEITEPQPFRSVEEAYAFVRSHEIATNKKYAVAKSKGMPRQDVSSLDSYKIQWEYIYGMKQRTESNSDGVPFISCGLELRVCQYGPPRKRRKPHLAGIKEADEEGEDVCDETDNQQVPATLEKSQQITDCPEKKRKKRSSKKLNCPAKVFIKKIMKFPEYAIEVGKGYPGKWFRNKLAKQLKEEFSENTKRYILVHVHIDNIHNHEDTPLQFQQSHRKTVHVVDKGCTRIPKIYVPTILPKGVPLLKKCATLKGKNLMDLAMQFNSTTELPSLLARPKASQKLEDMDDQELLSLYYDITEDMPNNMFSIANKEFTSSNLRLLLHLCIIFANAAGDASRQQQTHPSVRIKGTESNFTPVQCLEMDCPIIEPHMHCPFCAKTDSYTDTVLLKQHYMNKHVDKAIEFAGLRILRCYDFCEVVGKNKNSKTFNGGHWHCYKCPNGLDKRNSAFDHYQSHLKNYESSFQIQVAQDVYQSMPGLTVSHEIEVSSYQWETFQAAANLNTVSTTTKTMCSSSPLKRSYADADLYGLETLHQKAVYVQEDGIGSVTSTYTAQEIPTTGSDTYVITVPDGPELIQTKARVQELEISCKELEKENIVQKSHIDFLRIKDVNQSKLIEQYKTEKQDLTAQIEILKTEAEKLKSSEKSSRPSPKRGVRNSALIDREVSFDKARELEERIKTNEITSLSEEKIQNIRNNRPALKHNYGTRSARVKHFTMNISDDSSQEPFNVAVERSPSLNEDLSKLKNDKVESVASDVIPEAGEECSEASSSQPTTMEEMCHQLSSMRKDIELLKQAALGESSSQANTI